jgi:hypothetical protein
MAHFKGVVHAGAVNARDADMVMYLHLHLHIRHENEVMSLESVHPHQLQYSSQNAVPSIDNKLFLPASLEWIIACMPGSSVRLQR